MLCLCATLFHNQILAQIVPDSQLKVKLDSIANPGERLMKLEPALFAYSTDKARQLKLPSAAQYGFMSENLEAVFPELVQERTVNHMFGKNAFRSVRLKTVDHSALVPVLVATVQEQQEAILSLRRELDAMRKQMNAMTGTK